MIPRYARPAMSAIWLEDEKYKIWLEIELLALEAMEKLDHAPKGVSKRVRQKARFNKARIAKIEKQTRHDVLAFLTNIAEEAGAEARFLHQGLTSSDILDTALAIQLSRAGAILLEDLNRICAGLRALAETHIETLCVGRSHGIHAEPTSFGLKMLTFYAAFARARERLAAAVDDVSTCALSGPVGTFASIDPRVEAYVAEKLHLTPEPISTQIIPRDRHASFFTALALVAGSVEHFAVELRHLQRTELGEALEPFGAGQKGSSAMPHKRNPVLAENLTGLARIVRAYALPALENIALWHERDISHSSAERIAAPDATITLDFALDRLAGVVENLDVQPERMRQNLAASGWLPYSHAILLELTQAGLAREKAYAIVQRHAFAGSGEDFAKKLAADTEVKGLVSAKKLAGLCRPENYLRHAREILKRVLAHYERK